MYYIVVVYVYCCSILFFFFKQKTAYEVRISDWSSDVCSSDLEGVQRAADQRRGDEQRYHDGEELQRVGERLLLQLGGRLQERHQQAHQRRRTHRRPGQDQGQPQGLLGQFDDFAHCVLLRCRRSAPGRAPAWPSRRSERTKDA